MVNALIGIRKMTMFEKLEKLFYVIFKDISTLNDGPVAFDNPEYYGFLSTISKTFQGEVQENTYRVVFYPENDRIEAIIFNDTSKLVSTKFSLTLGELEDINKIFKV